jgi:hypothetical protein
MRNTKFEDGGEIDEMEAANKGEDLAAEQRGENILKAMRDAEAKPKVKPKPPAKKITRDAAGKPSNAGPDVLGSNYSRNTRSGATAKMMQPSYPSKESVMERRTQYKKAQDESAPSTFKKGGSIDGIAQRGKTRGKIC